MSLTILDIGNCCKYIHDILELPTLPNSIKNQREERKKKCEIRKKIRRTGRFSYMYIYIFFGMSGCAALCVVINDGVVVAGADKKGKITVKAVKISFFSMYVEEKILH